MAVYWPESHRFGIFVESLNQAPLRQKLDAILFEAVKNKTITTAEYLLINDIKSVKKAFLTFAYFEQRNRKLAEKAQQSAAQQQQNAAMQQMQMQMGIERMKIDGMLLGKKIESNAGQQEHLINQQGGIAKTRMKIEGDTAQIYHSAYADFLKQQQLLNDTGKNTPPPPPPPPQMQQPTAQNAPSPQVAQMQPEQLGTPQQLRESVVPHPSDAGFQ